MAKRRLLPLTETGANPLTQIERTLRAGQFGGRLFEFDTGEAPQTFQFQPDPSGRMIGGFRQLQPGFTEEELQSQFGGQDIFQLPISGRELGMRSTIQTTPQDQILRPNFQARAFQSPEESGFRSQVLPTGAEAPGGARFLSPEEQQTLGAQAEQRGQVQQAGVERQLQPQERPSLVIRAEDREGQLFGVFGGVGRDRTLRPIEQTYGIEPLRVDKIESLRIPEVAEERFPEARGNLAGIRQLPPELSQERQLMPQPSQGPSVQPGAFSGLQGMSLREQADQLQQQKGFGKTIAELQKQLGLDASSGKSDQGDLYRKQADIVALQETPVAIRERLEKDFQIPELRAQMASLLNRGDEIQEAIDQTPDFIKAKVRGFGVNASKLFALTDIQLSSFANIYSKVDRKLNTVSRILGDNLNAVAIWATADEKAQANMLKEIDLRIKGGEKDQEAVDAVFDKFQSLVDMQRQERQVQIQEQAGERERQAFDIETGRQRAEDAASSLVKIEPSSGNVIPPSADAITNAALRLGVPRDAVQRMVNDRIDDLNTQGVENLSKLAAIESKRENTVVVGKSLVNRETGEVIYQAPEGEDELTTNQRTQTFSSIVKQYNSSPLIAAADRVSVLADTITRVKASPTNGPDQLALIYGYVKALDQYDSAVREGEIALSQQVQSKVAKMQNYFEQINNGQILNKDAALDMAAGAQSLIDSVKTAASLKARSFQAQAETAGIGDMWQKYTSSFQTPFEGQKKTGGASQGGSGDVYLSEINVDDSKVRVEDF